MPKLGEFRHFDTAHHTHAGGLNGLGKQTHAAKPNTEPSGEAQRHSAITAVLQAFSTSKNRPLTHFCAVE
jgi:hypothetical protein